MKLENNLIAYFHIMKRPFRYVLYIMLGFLIYNVIDSEGSGFTHAEVKNALITALIVVFVLLLIVRVVKQRYDKNEDDSSEE